MEKLFGYFYKNRLTRAKRKKGYVDLAESVSRLTTFANLITPSQHSIEVGLSLWSCGFVGHELLLPTQTSWTEDRDLNFDLLKLLILKSVAIRELRINFQFKDKSRNYPRLKILAYMPNINAWLDQHFTNYASFEREALSKYILFLSSQPWSGNELFLYWKQQITSRVDSLVSPAFHERTNDEVYSYLLATVPLPNRQVNLIDGNSKAGVNPNASSKNSNRNRNRKEYALSVDKDTKGEVNPITHSFEKMNTLDDYSGGRRMASGEDELDDHSNALDEVELNQYTNQGKANSIFRQDTQLQKVDKSEASISSEEAVSKRYAEWNYRNNAYHKDHCHLFEIYPEDRDNAELRTDIIKQYTKEISYFRQQYSSLLNKPLWINRCVEGAELDVDSLIRIAPEFNRFSGNPRIFQNKKKQNSEMYISIVVDISYSTDTWIDGKKIIHIIRDSLIVFGEAIHMVGPQISVGLAFSQTRKNISYLSLLNFSSEWSQVYKKIHEFSARHYTRLGPSIRHASQNLHSQKSDCPLLIIITDGKPTDLDPYEGKYGQEDIKKSIDEAVALGISPLVIGVTDLAPDILAKMTTSCVNVKTPQDFCLEMGRFMNKMVIK